MLLEIGSMLSIDAGTKVFDKLKNHDKVEYIFHEDHLQVIKTIDSSYLGTPLVVSVDYRPESKK